MSKEYQELKMAYVGMASVLCDAKRLIGKLRFMCDHQGQAVEQVQLQDEDMQSIDRALEDVALYTAVEVRAVDGWSPYLEPK